MNRGRNPTHTMIKALLLTGLTALTIGAPMAAQAELGVYQGNGNSRPLIGYAEGKHSNQQPQYSHRKPNGRCPYGYHGRVTINGVANLCKNDNPNTFVRELTPEERAQNVRDYQNTRPGFWCGGFGETYGRCVGRPAGWYQF